MPGPKPVDIERWVRANYPETTTLILTAHDRDAFLAEMTVEAAGFITKDQRPKGSSRQSDVPRPRAQELDGLR
jgi:DNA-binding NarL/FixJ family response regulator